VLMVANIIFVSHFCVNLKAPLDILNKVMSNIMCD
jgi:hypothetical protein